MKFYKKINIIYSNNSRGFTALWVKKRLIFRLEHRKDNQIMEMAISVKAFHHFSLFYKPLRFIEMNGFGVKIKNIQPESLILQLLEAVLFD